MTDLSPRRLYVEITSYPVSDLLDLILLVAGERRTGSLKINFAGGKPDGTVEWKSSKRDRQEGNPS
jgi:hypothetical protein